MKRLSIIALTLLVILTSDLIAQTKNCGSTEYLELQKQLDPTIERKMQAIESFTKRFIETNRSLPSVITIPVVVHVVYRTNTENISTAQINSQIDVLNQDFRRLNSDADNTWPQAADTQIEFCLASVDPNGNPTSGITRTPTNSLDFTVDDKVKFNSSGGKDGWPADQYLNFWVCNIAHGILGYATRPGFPANIDGVVCTYTAVGNSGTVAWPYDEGRTATHEIGHYLNLRHIWGDGDCSVDDLVSDTPLSDLYNVNCTIGHISCGSVDMVQNYMDYSNDACMNLFTTGQKTRMRALFDPGGYRNSLLNSSGCGAPPSNCAGNINISGTATATTTLKAEFNISSTQTISPTANVTYQAGESVILSPGFWAKENSVFHAKIADCNTNNLSATIANTTKGLKNLDNVDLGTITKSANVGMLLTAKPNPFQNTTTLSFQLASSANTELTIHDINGRQISRLATEHLDKGSHEFVWAPNDLAPGIYFARLIYGDQVKTARIVLM